MPITDSTTTYQAAGGVVMSQDGREVLLLIRPGRDEVRLPNGHSEAEETPESAHSEKCAKRPDMTIWNSWLTLASSLSRSCSVTGRSAGLSAIS